MIIPSEASIDLAMASSLLGATTAILDAQSAKGAVKGRTLDPCGFDAGKKVLGRKRHVLADTQGLLLKVDVHVADTQDRDGLRPYVH